MSLHTSQPDTSTNEICGDKDSNDSSSSEIDVDGLMQHMDSLVEEKEKPHRQPIANVTYRKGAPDYSPDFIDKLIETAELDIDDVIQEPVQCLEITENGKSIPLGTLGSFSLIIGKPKSRKTFFLSALVAAVLKGGTVLDKVRGCLPVEKRNIVYFDTEQHRGYAIKVLKRIAALSGISKPKTLKTYCLKNHSPELRLVAIRTVIERTPNLGLIVIDGIRDTVFDINDAKEATDRATDLLQWTENKDAHLITVIHENKANGNARGHLGSELVNKAETAISVSLDTTNKDISVVTAEFCRGNRFDSFGFSIDKDELPFLSNGDMFSNDSEAITEDYKGKSRKPTYETMTPTQVDSIIQRAFSQQSQFRYTALLNDIIEASEFIGVPLAKSRAEQFLTRAVKQGQITKSDAGIYSLPLF